MEPKKENTSEPQTWANEIHEVFKSHGITQVSYVPDAGHSMGETSIARELVAATDAIQ